MHSGSGVEIRDAWSPPAPPGVAVLAVYATLVAHDEDTLLSVATPIAATAEIHSTAEVNGMMQMRPVRELHLAAGQTVRLEPGGMHLMLVNVAAERAADAPIAVTFQFAHAGAVTVNVPVKRAP
jgi:hypothetical protein